MKKLRIRNYFNRVFSIRGFSFYAVMIGIIILSIWVFIIFSGEIKEGKIEIIFHVISELLMALASIISGFLVFKKMIIGLVLGLISQSAIIYSVVNTIGYYWQTNEFAMVPLLIIVFVFSICFIFSLSVLISKHLLISLKDSLD